MPSKKSEETLTAEPRVVTAWHWLGQPDRLRGGQPVKLGRIYRLPAAVKPRICSVGYHASEKLFDAVAYAPGPWLTRVELSGEFSPQEGNTDKLCASQRRILWLMNAENVIRLFLADVAEELVAQERANGREPHEDILNAIQVARDFVAGKAAKRDLRIAEVLSNDAIVEGGWGYGARYMRYAHGAVSRKPLEQLRELARALPLDNRCSRDELNAKFEAMVLAVAPKPVAPLTAKQRWDRTQKLRKPTCKGDKTIAATLIIQHERDFEASEKLLLSWDRVVEQRKRAYQDAQNAEYSARKAAEGYITLQVHSDPPKDSRTFNRELKKLMEASRCALEKERQTRDAWQKAQSIYSNRIYAYYEALPSKQRSAIDAKLSKQ